MESFEEVFRKYSPVVYRYLLSLCADGELAEELTSETFYQAYLHIDSFRGDCRVQTWLCQIARNALRKEQKRKDRILPLDYYQSTEMSEDLVKNLSDKEQVMQIHKQLNGLKDPYKEVFMLRIFGELSFKDIAAVFGKTESWAKVTFYRAKDKLIERMEAVNHDEL